MTTKDQARFFSILADLLLVGFSLGEALNFIKVVLPTKQMVLEKMIQSLKQGEAFSKAVQMHVKEDIYYQILIAEKHGQLAESLKTLGNYLNVKFAHKSRLIQLLEYPVLLIFFLGLLMIGMKTYIFPQLNQWNLATQVHKFKYTALYSWGVWGSLLGILSYFFRRFSKQPIFKRVEVLCRLPIIGKVYQTYCHYYLSLNLAMLLKSGLGIKSICALLASFSPTSLLYQIGDALEKQLTEGQQTVSFINRYPFIPQELNILLNKGSTTDSLGQELVMFSRIKYQKLTQQVERLIGFMQPLMFLIIGLIIVFMYLSLLLPMYHSMGGVYK